MKVKHLKIAEQIIIISLIGVLAPSIVSWVIINNISRHSIRRELNDYAQTLVRIVENNISSVIKSDENRLNEIITGLKYIKEEEQQLYLKDIAVNSNTFRDFEIIRPSENPDFNISEKTVYNYDEDTIRITEKIHDDKYIRAEIDTKPLKNEIFKDTAGIEQRRIYITDTKGSLIYSHNYDEKDFENCIKQLPVNLVNNIAAKFDETKNRPRVYLKMNDLGLIIIVNTSKELADETINRAGIKILTAFLAAAAVTLLLNLMYSYYLYSNIRRLFRGIIAVSRGNYIRPVILKTNIFTPREIVFLAEQFNSMINKIEESYNELEKKNKELKQLDSFRSNLVDTVSHELRTPLTGIKGYTSRLLRTDIKIDEETKHKSLLVIKRQAERLSRMIEDLLVIPDIEGAKLNINIEPVNLLECIESALYSVKNIENRRIENSITNSFPFVMADKDRLEQVFINLIGNADKYAYEGAPLKINASADENKAVIAVSNSADYIEENILNTLFDKFIRLDDKTTRTTRGTGLGLYIVKGLIEAMNGSVRLISTPDNVFTAEIMLDIYKEEENEA